VTAPVRVLVIVQIPAEQDSLRPVPATIGLSTLPGASGVGVAHVPDVSTESAIGQKILAPVGFVGKPVTLVDAVQPVHVTVTELVPTAIAPPVVAQI